MKTNGYENDIDWDVGIPWLLFVIRESVQESLGFSPNELIFGHQVRGLLYLLKEKWLNPDVEKTKVLEHIQTFKERIRKACTIAKENLKESQSHMKSYYDKDSVM